MGKGFHPESSTLPVLSGTRDRDAKMLNKEVCKRCVNIEAARDAHKNKLGKSRYEWCESDDKIWFCGQVQCPYSGPNFWGRVSVTTDEYRDFCPYVLEHMMENQAC